MSAKYMAPTITPRSFRLVTWTESPRKASTSVTVMRGFSRAAGCSACAGGIASGPSSSISDVIDVNAIIVLNLPFVVIVEPQRDHGPQRR